MCRTAIRKLAEVLTGEERLMKLLGTNPCERRFSESQLLLVVQHRSSLDQLDCEQLLLQKPLRVCFDPVNYRHHSVAVVHVMSEKFRPVSLDAFGPVVKLPSIKNHCPNFCET